MKSLNIDPKTLLRVGLGGVFIYAGISSLVFPAQWANFIPVWLSSLVSTTLLLNIHSFINLVLGVGLMTGRWLKLFALISFINMLTILMLVGVDAVTFRDFGLLMSALALLVLSSRPEDG